eukprot:CAMPEP_0168335716 /NCGR_PEP_ID=MMETSP0213-20121227/11085_1 /TAXON_ID=151035 /ORGANISM="Euplotes harpa, Strain FSP1.4" /LENGTH=147 /DNA_ID=CAMNT_0008340717 /DNA_START=257 /DNA_END=697 /DNA_ORIENTATION=+
MVINDKNFKIMETHCKCRELKFLNLEIVLRKAESIRALEKLLNYFKNIKDSDTETFNKLVEENPNAEKAKISYIPQNYVSIKINTYPLKYNENIIGLLEYICPQTFELPVKYIPNLIIVDHSDCKENVSDEFFNKNYIVSELENKFK